MGQRINIAIPYIIIVLLIFVISLQVNKVAEFYWDDHQVKVSSDRCEPHLTSELECKSVGFRMQSMGLERSLLIWNCIDVECPS
jgi:hypothetical protein